MLFIAILYVCIVSYAVGLVKDGVYHLLELSAPSSGSIKMIDQVARLFAVDILTHSSFFYIDDLSSLLTRFVAIMALYKLAEHMKMRGREAFDEKFGPGESSAPKKVMNYRL